jgi:hypothetical protein
VKLLETNAALAFRWLPLAAIFLLRRAHGSDMLFQNLVLDESHTVFLVDQQVRRLRFQPLLEFHLCDLPEKGM